MTEPPTWTKSRRRIVTALLLFHMLAAISAPLASPPPVSNVSKSLIVPFKWYLNAAYMNHGYRYFNVVGSTSIMRYELTMPNGERRKLRFADRNRVRPRLFYHRHLMVGETIFNAVNLPSEEQFRTFMTEQAQQVRGLRREGFERLADQIQRNIERNEADFIAAKSRRRELLKSVARYLIRKHGAVSIRIFVQAHKIPSREDIETGTILGDDALYVEQLVDPMLYSEFGSSK